MQDNSSKRYRLLLVSSLPPSHSAGLTQAKIDGLTEAGHEVDYLTVYDYDGRPDNVIAIYPKPTPVNETLLRKWLILPLRKAVVAFGIYDAVKKLKDFFGHKTVSEQRGVNAEGLQFLYPDEANPPVPVDRLLSKINKPYDAVITLFWQGMLNTTSIRAIYNRLKCPFLICAPDMAPMTGGCYYFGSCRNFITGCGKCPALGSTRQKDQSSENYQLKKHNLAAVNCAFLGNTWMNGFARQSGLFRNVFRSEIIIDENKFHPADMPATRHKLNLPIDKFLILVQSNCQPRKGNDDLIRAVDALYAKLPETDRKRVELLIVGDDYLLSQYRQCPFRTHHFGTVAMERIIECYQAANVYVCTSIDDAGPSMINQSIMCGTPVVSYESGAALDVIQNERSGYKAPVRDTDGLADGIYQILYMPQDRYDRLRHTTRITGVAHNSMEVHINNLISCIEQLSFDRSFS